MFRCLCYFTTLLPFYPETEKPSEFKEELLEEKVGINFYFTRRRQLREQIPVLLSDQIVVFVIYPFEPKEVFYSLLQVAVDMVAVVEHAQHCKKHF